ncbi:MAG: cytochrome B [Flavobacteriia bacterium]
MHDILVRSHSGLRYIALGLLLYAIVNAILSRSKGHYAKKDKMINLFAMVFLHVQLLLGLILYFTSPKVVFVEGWMKVAQSRFFGLEHILMMVLAIVIVTIGRKKAEKESNPAKKHSKIMLWYLIGLFLIFAAIPWPFRNLGVTTWF